MKGTSGLFALLTLAIVAIVSVVAVTRPVGVLPAPPGSSAEARAAPATTDAGSLDSLLDGVRVEHAIKHGR